VVGKTGDISNVLQKLKEKYLTELPAKIDDMEEIALRMENRNGFLENSPELYRLAHSLKGSAGSYGFPDLTAICHRVEDYLEPENFDVSSAPGDVSDLILRHIDLMREYVLLVQDGETLFSHIGDKLNSLKRDNLAEIYSGLLVDGSLTTSQLCLSTLKQYPIEFTVVQDGITALERLLAEDFDILITAMELVNLNGLALVAASHMSSRSKETISTVLITSHNIESHGRGSDPDFVVLKDENMASNLCAVIEEINLV
jgi:chemotaxis protein histidine kinase CheA